MTTTKTGTIPGLLFCLLISGNVFGAEYFLESFNYYVNIPAHWQVYSAETEDYLIFREKEGKADFHVLSGSQFLPGTDPEEVTRHMLAGLSPELETSPFSYNGLDAVFGSILFRNGGTVARGYVITIALPDRYAVLLSYAPDAYFGGMTPQILSCLDGFSYSAEGLSTPGPVSQFYYGFPGADPRPYPVQFGEHRFTVELDPGGAEASQIMIEREAAILADKNNFSLDAWKRYYKMIYRDSYARLYPLAEKIVPLYGIFDDYRIAAELLAALQGFEYLRTGTLSDLQSPVSSCIMASGDCDSLGLLYSILLDYFGIDSVLMVSIEYGHSIVGVDVPGPGARFSHEGTEYLVAELTDSVQLGLIDSQMADPSKWAAVEF